MDYKTALNYAEKIEAWLAPYCYRIQIAGSVRRRRPICNDIDIVCIPRHDDTRDMFGEVTSRRSAVFNFLDRYIAGSEGRASWISGRQNPDGRNYLVQLPKCQLDIFNANPATWGSILMCRTGSKEHNIWLAARVKAMGGHWNPYNYLTINEHPVDISSEEPIYKAVGVDFIYPGNREHNFPAS